MALYIRITAYYPEKDICFIADSFGRFEKKWQFSSYLISKNIKIIEINDNLSFLDGNLPKIKEIDAEHIILRACGKGKPHLTNNGIEVNGKYYETQI